MMATMGQKSQNATTQSSSPHAADDSTILIVGASGRVGGAICRRLLQQQEQQQLGALGLRVRAAVRNPESFLAAQEQQAQGQTNMTTQVLSESASSLQITRLDMIDPTTFEASLLNVTCIFLMWPPGTSPKHVHAFVKAASATGVVRRIVFLSVFGADRMTFLPHAKIEKMIQELMTKAEEEESLYVFLRAGYFMQNLSTIHAADIATRRQVSLPTGNGRISMVDVEDVAEAACVGLLRIQRQDCHENGVAWDLTGSVALSMQEVAQQLTEVLGTDIVNVNPSVWRFYFDQRAQGTSMGLALFMVAEYTHARLHLAERIGDGVQRALGRSPTTFREFAQREQRVWRHQDGP